MISCSVCVCVQDNTNQTQPSIMKGMTCVSWVLLLTHVVMLVRIPVSSFVYTVVYLCG